MFHIPLDFLVIFASEHINSCGKLGQTLLTENS